MVERNKVVFRSLKRDEEFGSPSALGQETYIFGIEELMKLYRWWPDLIIGVLETMSLFVLLASIYGLKINLWVATIPFLVAIIVGKMYSLNWRPQADDSPRIIDSFPYIAVLASAALSSLLVVSFTRSMRSFLNEGWLSNLTSDVSPIGSIHQLFQITTFSKDSIIVLANFIVSLVHHLSMYNRYERHSFFVYLISWIWSFIDSILCTVFLLHVLSFSANIERMCLEFLQCIPWVFMISRFSRILCCYFRDVQDHRGKGQKNPLLDIPGPSTADHIAAMAHFCLFVATVVSTHLFRNSLLSCLKGLIIIAVGERIIFTALSVHSIEKKYQKLDIVVRLSTDTD